MKFADVVIGILNLINMAVGVLSTLALVVFFWGLVRYIYNSADSHEHSEGRERIVWSLIALFVLFSIWGLVGLLRATFFPNAAIDYRNQQTIYENSGNPF